MLPEQESLPAPDDNYFEIEVAKLHGGWPRWEQLRPQQQALLMAHELHKNMRDHYHYDMRKPGDSVAKPQAVDQRMRDRFFS